VIGESEVMRGGNRPTQEEVYRDSRVSTLDGCSPARSRSTSSIVGDGR
jgi:hypothetical protein